MTASTPQHEPTMEEILASIRKIISDDQPDPNAAPAAKAPEPAPVAIAPQPAPAPAASASFDVLELTDEIVEERVEEPAPEPVVFAEPEPEPEPEPVMEPVIDVPDDLISDNARSAVDRVIDSLNDDPSARRSLPSSVNLDALLVHAIREAFDPVLKQWVQDHQSETFDRLKPIIRDWMDSNLPPLIEAAVQKEIARAVAARKR